MESSQHQDHLISQEVQQSQDVLHSQENEQPQDLKHIDAPDSSSVYRSGAERIPSPRGVPVSQESEKLPPNHDNDQNKELVSSQVKEPDQPNFLGDQAESMNRPEPAGRDNDTLVVNGCQLIRSSLDCPPYLTSGHLSANLDLGLISSDGHLVLVNKLCFAVHSTYAQALCCDISADQGNRNLIISWY